MQADNGKHRFIKCKLCLTNLFASYSRLALQTRGRIVDAAYLDFSKAFNTVRKYSQHASLDVTVWMDRQLDVLKTGWMIKLRR